MPTKDRSHSVVAGASIAPATPNAHRPLRFWPDFHNSHELVRLDEVVEVFPYVGTWVIKLEAELRDSLSQAICITYARRQISEGMK